MGAKAAANQASDVWTLGVGKIIAGVDGGLAVTGTFGRATARLAASCLVAPEPGDDVLCVVGITQCYVLAVLVRRGQSPMRLVLEGGALFQARGGSLTLEGDKEIRLETAGNLQMKADQVLCKAAIGHFLFGSAELTGHTLRLATHLLATTADTIWQTAGELMQKVRSYTRHTENVEVVHAGELHQMVDATATLRAEQVVILADGLVRVDGDRIHIA
ncbi:DUF3540 domain-containing protein [Cupriavidus sp. D39]|uniref:DUF3540 domain-containing protein n=1 Tax=Cupriavidus sp. D39 TaxID=2997877 RepID=UPI00226FBB9F|nr:DUF3540 domain-containing protein [Cupriavidus sp. D39]MCY0858681.1 DUF3540 domain-containing protein [Cupriavidus sp. D39]